MSDSSAPVKGKVPEGPAKTPTQARQAVTTGVVRWVLAGSLVLAIVVMVVAFAFR